VNTLERMAMSESELEKIEKIKQKVKKDTARQIFSEIQHKLKESGRYYESTINDLQGVIYKRDYLDADLIQLIRCKAILGFISVFSSQTLDEIKAKYLPKKSKKVKRWLTNQ